MLPKIVVLYLKACFLSTVVPWHLWDVGSRSPVDTKILGCLSPLYKMAYLHITYSYPLSFHIL